jgi:PAS domain S-box-containing protein
MRIIDESILVVGDNRANLKMLELILERGGYRVRTAGSRELDLCSVLAEPPMLILLDIKSQGKDGYEVCRELKKEKKSSAIPVICMCAMKDKSEKMKGLQAGCADYITKPLQEEEILARVKTQISLRRAQLDLEAKHTRISARNTQLMQAEASINESEIRYRRLFEAAKDGILLVNARTGEIEDANPFILELLGYSLAELQGKRVWDIGLFKDIAANQAAFRKLSKKKFVRYDNLPLQTRDGRTAYVEFVSNVYDVSGKEVIQCNIRDISQRTQAEEKIRSLAKFPSENPFPILRINQDGKILYANAASRGLLKDWGSTIGSDTPPFWRDLVTEALTNKSQKTVDVSFGEQIFSFIVVPVLDASYVNLYGRDITDRNKAQEALSKSEKEFRLLAEAMPQIVWITRADGWNIYFNQQWVDYTGLTLEESYGHGWNKPFHPDDQQRAWDAWQDAVTNNASYSLECRLRRKDGLYFWWLIRGVPVIDENGEISKWFGTCTDINEIKQVEEALKKNENRFRALIVNNADAITLLDASGIAIYDSPAAAGMLGYGPEDWIGQRVFELIHPDDLQKNRELFEEVSGNPGARINSTFRVRHKSGKWLWIDMVVTNLLNEPGVNAIVLNYRDVSERKTAEEALLESEQKYRNLITQSPDGVFIVDLQGNFLSVNGAMCKGLHYSENELLAMKLWDIVPESYLVQHKKRMMKIFSGKSTNEPAEYQVRGKDGSENYVEVLSAPYYRENKVIGFQGIARDITERKNADEALARERNLLRTLIDNLPDIIYVKDDQSRFVLANVALARAMGAATPDELLGKKDHDYFPEELADQFYSVDQEVIQTGLAVIDKEEDFIYPDGSWGQILTTQIPLRDEKGKVTRLVGIGRDITDRNRVEEALRVSEEQLRLITNNMLDMVVQTDLEGIYLYASPSHKSILGYEPTSLLGKSTFDLIHPEDVERVRTQTFSAIQEGRSGNLEYRYRHADGYYLWLESAAALIYDNQKVPVGAVFTTRDITARKQAEITLGKRLKELTVLHEIAGAAAQAGSLDELLEGITQTINKSLYPDNCGVLLFDEQARVLCPHQSYVGAVNMENREIIIPLGQGVTGSVASSRKPARIANLESETNYVNVNPESRSELCVPVLSGTRLLGVINAESVRTDAFTESDEHLMLTIARTLATAIEKIYFIEETSRRLEQVQVLHKIDTAINNSLDLSLIFSIFIDQTKQQLGVDAVDILVYQPESHYFQYLVGQGFRTSAHQRSQLRLGQGYPGQAGAERKTIHKTDLRSKNAGFLRSPDFNSEEFDTYFGVPLIAKGQLKGVLEIFQRGPLEKGREWMDFLEILAGQAAIAIDNTQLFEDLQRSNVNLRMAYDETVEGWVKSMDLRDMETKSDPKLLAEMTVKLAESFGCPPEELVHIRRGAWMHDIGKLRVPDEILQKPGALSDKEWAIMRNHPQSAFEMLSPISYLQKAVDIPFCHHEKFDGSGYPRGLKGEEIPLAARIFAVVDVFDSLTTSRPFRGAWTREEALVYIREQAGIHFDPAVVEAFLKLNPQGYGNTPLTM